MTQTAGTNRRLPAMLAGAIALIGAMAAAPPARADDFVDRANAPFARIPDAKRSDLVILPALARTTPPPAGLTDWLTVALQPANGATWGFAEEWAMAEPQRDLLAALKQITEEEDHRIAMVFAQGYGVEAVSSRPDLIETGMYTELGDPPTLAAARIQYMPALDRIVILAHIEATRLAAAGDRAGAIEVLFDCLHFGRQMAQRGFAEEVEWGLRTMRFTLERLRDIAFEDSRAERQALTFEDMLKFVKRLEDRSAYVGIDRLRPPPADLLGADQILARVMGPDRKPDPQVFGLEMAKISSGTRPLRLLSESAYWERASRLHAGLRESREMLRLVGEDWGKRWSLSSWFDPLVRRETDFAKRVAKGAEYAVLRQTLRRAEPLFQMKQNVLVETIGTRTGFAIYGYFLRYRSYPPDITAIRPTFVTRVDLDPYHPAKRPLEYFRPMIDRPPPDRYEGRQPYEVKIWPGGKFPNFAVKLRDDTFALSSVGPAEASAALRDATQGDTALEGDYILWPPLISLLRKNLAEAGAFR